MNYHNPLLDKEFLKQLDYYNHKTTYVRLTALNNKDIAVEQIEGRVTGGSINIDGNSAVRRSCSLSLVVLNNDNIITNTYWALENKFKLEIGLKNDINSQYPDIIWFKQGVFIINNFTHNKSTTAINVSIYGQDKMCLLNGTLGGAMAHETDFGTIEEEDGEGNIKITKLTVYNIIKNAVLMYGQERPENIIINDLDDVGYEVLEYRGDTPMYLLIDKENSKKIYNCVFDEIEGFTKVNKYYSLNTLDNEYNKEASVVKLDTEDANVTKIEYGETAGYHQIPLVYNNDLILKTGEAITSLFDKIKNMLGNFEYFYDIDGRFIFQKKKTYVQDMFNPLNGELNVPFASATPYSYRFDDYKLFTAISNSPKVNNIKNDYVIWGVRKNISGSNLPIHVRYTIDKKPESYKSPYDKWIKVENLYYIVATEIKQEDLIEGSLVWQQTDTGYVEVSAAANNTTTTYYTLQVTKEYPWKQKLKGDGTPETNEDGSVKIIPDDSCKVLYRGAPDKYYNCDKLIDLKIIALNSQWVINKGSTVIIDYSNIKNNISKIEYDSTTNLPIEVKEDLLKKVYWYIPSQEYRDEWREIIYQISYDYYQHHEELDYINKITLNNPDLVFQGKTGYESYYTDIQGFWRQLYNPLTIYDELTGQEFYNSEGYDGNGTKAFWNKKIHTDPNGLVFWFEFLDNYGQLENYSVKNIGLRTKTDNQSTTTGIFYKDIPEALYLYSNEELIKNDDDSSYTPLQLNINMEDLFSRSSQGVSAIERANELIYQHTCLGEGLTITSIPIYYLQPNTRIYVEGEGDCTLDKLSYQLTHNGTMSLTCTKIIEPFNM